MSSVLVQLGYYTLSYAGLLLFFFFAVNFFLKGFLYHWLRVRPSQGKKLLIFSKSNTDVYVTHAILDDEGFYYKRRDGKINRHTKLDEGDTYPAFSVWCVDYDETKNRVINKTNLERGEVDPNDTDRMLAKAVDLPKIAGLKANLLTWTIIILIIGMIVLGSMLWYSIDQAGQILEVLNRAGVV